MASLHVGRVRGVPVRLHWSFLLVLPFFALLMSQAYFGGMEEPWPWVWGSLLALGLFASVLVHEFAHSFVALARGVGIRSITLLPIGGVSTFEEVPKDPRAEIEITIAGPLTNVLIGGPVFLFASLAPFEDPVPGLRAFLGWFGLLNLVLAGFNLLVPAIPMDGGRILRAALTRPLGRAKATRVAGTVGRVLAIALGAWGLLVGGWILVLIAVVIYLGAGAEERMVQLSETLGRFAVSDLMTPDVDVLDSSSTVEHAFARMLSTRHVAFPVARADGAIVGLVRLVDLARVPVAERPFLPVEAVARTDHPVLAPDDDASLALERLAGETGSAALVEDEVGRLVGIVTGTDLARFAEILAASERSFAQREA